MLRHSLGVSGMHGLIRCHSTPYMLSLSLEPVINLSQRLNVLWAMLSLGMRQNKTHSLLAGSFILLSQAYL